VEIIVPLEIEKLIIILKYQNGKDMGTYFSIRKNGMSQGFRSDCVLKPSTAFY